MRQSEPYQNLYPTFIFIGCMSSEWQVHLIPLSNPQSEIKYGKIHNGAATENNKLTCQPESSAEEFDIPGEKVKFQLCYRLALYVKYVNFSGKKSEWSNKNGRRIEIWRNSILALLQVGTIWLVSLVKNSEWSNKNSRSSRISRNLEFYAEFES